MRRGVILTLALAGGLALDWVLVQIESRAAAAPSQFAVPDQSGRTVTVDQLCQGRLKLLDLTWPLNAKGAYWPADNYKPFELHTIATLENNGVLSKSFCMPEHQGTHIDAPNHFEAGQPSVDELRLEDLFAPGVVIDVSARAAQDADYRLTVADVDQWEQQHGQIPSGALVLLHTGWGRHFMDPPRYRNQDVMGRMHFPGYSAEAVRHLLERRRIRGVGIDTLSVDYGLSRDFAAHHALNHAGRYGLENLAQLDKLPPRGFYLVVAPIKIETGSGGPTRVMAVLP